VCDALGNEAQDGGTVLRLGQFQQLRGGFRQAMTADEGKERHFAYVVDEPHHQVAAQARQAHRSVRVPRIQIGEIEIRVGREGMDHRLDGHPVREFQWFEFREGGDHTMALVGNIVIIG